MKQVILLALILALFPLTACNNKQSGGADRQGLESPAQVGNTVQSGQPAEADGKIKAAVSKNCNYVYHMLSVSKCGYDNEYGRRYQSLHPQTDLQTLKSHENLITVAGGEHTGGLYQLCVALPASLEDDVSLQSYFDALIDLFESDDLEKNLERYRTVYEQTFAALGATIDLDSLKQFYLFNEPMKKELTDILRVLRSNFTIYSEQVWPDTNKELTSIADELNKELNATDYAAKWEEALNCEFGQERFLAVLCNSIQDGPQCIDISQDKDVFYHSGEYPATAKLISHEFGIYLLKEQLKDTEAFQDFSYYELVEGLAEYYNITVSGGHKEWDWGTEYIEFYQQLKEVAPDLTAKEMFLRAADHFQTA